MEKLHSKHTKMRESKSSLKTCTGRSSAAWHLLTRPDTGRKHTDDSAPNSPSSSHHGLTDRASSHLLKLLLDVAVRLQFDLPPRVGPVHQEQPLLGVHLFNKDGCFFVVPHLEMKPHTHTRRCTHTHTYD